MELPKIKRTEGGMLDGIKSKLGFADANQGYDEGYYDEQYGDYGDDYGEYGDYGSGYDDAPESDAPASRYDPYAPVTTRPARASHARSSSRPGFTPAKLVSIDDVRAHTQVPESLTRDPLPPRRGRLALRAHRTGRHDAGFGQHAERACCRRVESRAF